jgi:hypothetical protein
MLALSIISLVVAVSAAGFAGLQVIRMRQTWQAQNALEVARDIQSNDQREARRRLYVLKARGTDYGSWTLAQKHEVDTAIQQLNTAAYLGEQRLLPPRMLEENWNVVFRQVYRAAEPRINDYVDRGAQEPWGPFRRFATRMIALNGEPPPYFEEGEVDD